MIFWNKALFCSQYLLNLSSYLSSVTVSWCVNWVTKRNPVISRKIFSGVLSNNLLFYVWYAVRAWAIITLHHFLFFVVLSKLWIVTIRLFPFSVINSHTRVLTTHCLHVLLLQSVSLVHFIIFRPSFLIRRPRNFLCLFLSISFIVRTYIKIISNLR